MLFASWISCQADGTSLVNIMYTKARIVGDDERNIPCELWNVSVLPVVQARRWR
jgi:hypothetical protein